MLNTNKIVQEPNVEGIRAAAPVGSDKAKSVGDDASFFSDLKILQKKKLSSLEIFFFG